MSVTWPIPAPKRGILAEHPEPGNDNLGTYLWWLAFELVSRKGGMFISDKGAKGTIKKVISWIKQVFLFENSFFHLLYIDYRAIIALHLVQLFFTWQAKALQLTPVSEAINKMALFLFSSCLQNKCYYLIQIVICLVYCCLRNGCFKNKKCLPFCHMKGFKYPTQIICFSKFSRIFCSMLL